MSKNKNSNHLVTALLNKKNSFLKEFLRLTARQKEALTEKDMEKFNKLMESKQAIIEQVDIIDVELVFHKTGAAGPGIDAAGGKTDLNTGLEESIKQLLQQIRALDMEVNELMKQNLSETIKSINELQVARRTETAYRGQALPANSCFINQKR